MDEQATTQTPAPEQNGTAPEAAPPEAPQAVGEKTLDEMFRYAEYVHVGPGAENCEEGEKGTCGDPLHFHAFCRLPNQFQHSDIREKANGAKARRQRQMRTEGMDSHDILEADLDDIRRSVELSEDPSVLVDEIVQKTWWKDHQRAQAEVDEREEFETIQKDFERARELEAMPEDQRPAEEFEELRQHTTKYMDAVTAKRDEIQKPQRDALMSRETDELIEMVRKDRIEQEGSNSFMETYSKWEWYLGTLKPVEEGSPSVRVFESIEHLEGAAPEVVDALDRTFTMLERAMQGGQTGNS